MSKDEFLNELLNYKSCNVTLTIKNSDCSVTLLDISNASIQYVESRQWINISGWQTKHDMTIPIPEHIEKTEIDGHILYELDNENYTISFITMVV